MSVAPEFAKEDGAESEKRANGEIDATGEDDGSHDESQEADFDGVTKYVAGIVVGGEAAADCAKVKPFENENEEQDRLVPNQDLFEHFRVHFVSRILTPSAITARRMMVP